MEMHELLAFMNEKKASDLHLSSKHPPVLRVHGEMVPVRVPEMSPEVVKELVLGTMTEPEKKKFEEELEIDYAITYPPLRFRVNAFHTHNGVAAVFRIIPEKIITLQELGTPAIFEKLCRLRQGLILVTGSTGHGKSTTLAAMIDYMNQNMARHIITIEDPIEFIHTSKKSLINQREAGRHTLSFTRALKSALREDPDVLLVGELRDIETIRLTLTAAETGHLVVGTLHTNSAAKTLDRIIDVFPGEEKDMVKTMLSNTLEAIISQVLIKKSDDSGRVAAFETLIATPAIRNMIREGRVPQIYSLMQVGKQQGMTVMKDSIEVLLKSGIILPESAQHAINASGEETKTEKRLSPGSDNKF